MILPGPRRRSGHRMNPSGLFSGLRFIAVEILARPGDLLAFRSCEHHLEQLQRAHAKCRERPGEVKPPGPDKFRVEHLFHLTGRILEPAQPVFERLRVMEAQVFYILDGKIPGLKNLKRFAQRRSIRARENPLSNPAAERPRLISPNKMKEPATRVSDTSMDDSSQLFVVLCPDVFEHADGNECVASA